MCSAVANLNSGLISVGRSITWPFLTSWTAVVLLCSLWRSQQPSSAVQDSHDDDSGAQQYAPPAPPPWQLILKGIAKMALWPKLFGLSGSDANKSNSDQHAQDYQPSHVNTVASTAMTSSSSGSSSCSAPSGSKKHAAPIAAAASTTSGSSNSARSSSSHAASSSRTSTQNDYEAINIQQWTRTAIAPLVQRTLAELQCEIGRCSVSCPCADYASSVLQHIQSTLSKHFLKFPAPAETLQPVMFAKVESELLPNLAARLLNAAAHHKLVAVQNTLTEFQQ